MYIITEDSNSARDFWQCVAQTFRSVDSFLLVSFPIGSDGQTASGNTTLKAQVLSIFPKLQAGDKVFVAVDCVANNTKGFIAHDFVKWGTRLCMKKGAEFVATSYWCFEDLYLSYDEVLAMYLKNPVAENVHYSMYMIICKMEQIILIPVARFRTLLIYITAQEKTENTLQTNC